MNTGLLDISSSIKRNMFFYISILMLSLAFLRCSSDQKREDASYPKTISVKSAGVASAHIEASKAGVEILKQGGNAADAATAVAMALAVVYPQAGNLGGGGFLLYRMEGGDVYALDFRETAPAAAHRDMYLTESGEAHENKSLLGGLAVGVPGTVRGFSKFHQKFGALEWQKVLEPAIRLAEEGFVISGYQERSFKYAADRLARFPSSKRVFLQDGQPPEEGDLFIQKDLAKSLTSIALHGEKAFYEGEIARSIVKSVRMNGGILSLEDLRNYQAVERNPLKIEYNGYSIYALPPPSSGGVVIGGIFEALKIRPMNRYPLHSADQIAFLSELEKYYFVFRNQLLGDPDFVEMPLGTILSEKFARKIVCEINPEKPSPAKDLSAEKFIHRESEETTHFSVLDSNNNAVSVTYTLNGSYGCKLVAGNTGILLNNEMDDFAIKPGTANMFGLVQGEANRIEPGKRMLSSMTPVIVTQNGHLKGLLGSPGGPKIITTVLQVLINLIDYELSPQQAISAGRFHQQWLPDSIYIEQEKFSGEVLKTLELWGYGLVKRNRLGDVQAIWKNGVDWFICSDPRGNGLPRGY